MLVVYSLRDCCRTRTVSIDPPQRNVISVLMMAAIKELKLPPPKVFATPERYER